jgi:hypothetical protein
MTGAARTWGDDLRGRRASCSMNALYAASPVAQRESSPTIDICGAHWSHGDGTVATPSKGTMPGRQLPLAKPGRWLEGVLLCAEAIPASRSGSLAVVAR